jgi:hypothetical protein
MNCKFISLIISFLIFNGYLVYAYKKWGITRSISATFDLLEEEGKELIFQIVQIGFSLTLVAAAIFSTIDGELSWQGIILGMAATSIICSSLAGDTEEHKKIMRNHVYEAAGGIILAALYMLLSGFWWLIAPGILATAYVMKKPITNHTYWIEVMWFHLTLISLL